MSNVLNLLSMSVVLVSFVYTIAAIRWRSPWRIESSSSTEQGFQHLEQQDFAIFPFKMRF